MFTYDMPGTVLGSRDTAVKDKVHPQPTTVYKLIAFKDLRLSKEGCQQTLTLSICMQVKSGPKNKQINKQQKKPGGF